MINLTVFARGHVLLEGDVGVGGHALKPIPEFDSEGRAIGFWGVSQVLQTDVQPAGNNNRPAGAASGAGDTAMPSPTMTEHLSSLRGPHLQQLARDAQLGYHRLVDAPALLGALTVPEFARPAPARADLRSLLAGLALALLVAVHLPSLAVLLAWPPSRRGFGRRG